MSTDYLPKITPRDLSILEGMLEQGLGDAKLTNAIRRKLQLAQIVFADDLQPNVVTLGSRLAFQLDDRPIEERVLVTMEHYVPGQDGQSIASLNGIAMLGLTEGNCVEIEGEDEIKTLSIIQVLYQPEADRRRRGVPAGLRLVSNREDTAQAVKTLHRTTPHDDDPGPSAA